MPITVLENAYLRKASEHPCFSETHKKMEWEYVDKNREGDHICYISDLRKMKEHYPSWKITKSLEDIFSEIVEAWKKRARDS